MNSVKVGDIIDVRITGIQPYGAFALLPDLSSGLIHISEISDSFVKDINEYVKNGDSIRVKVIDIDEKTHQAKLSLKAISHTNRKYKRTKFKRELINETPSGFDPLYDQLQKWIDIGVIEEEK